MRRLFCILFAVVMLVSLDAQSFAEGVLYCRMCGKQIPVDSNVCCYCGEKVVTVEETGGDLSALAADLKNTAVADPATATDIKASSASPATSSAAVPGPFNTVLGSTFANGNVRVTKSPTSESVPYGGSCMFIAHAANATSVTWYIANSDCSLITTAAEAPGNVPGLSVSGSNSDTLVLSGIPSWMNGCQVQACFTGDGGPVYTEIARIWTYEEEQVDPYSWNWWDYYWYNHYWWDFWDDDEPNPPDVDHAVTLPNGKSVAPEMPGPGFIYEDDEATVVSHTHTANSASDASSGSNAVADAQS